ncbi:hypothetical protein GCM10023189_05310 [Nibrella saemangeumensis]|uniref:Integrase catalytic domain-containing protein n=1 Tax=Nibrella saemangeumensis TaxID=1084526 RepID=A0ABP8MDA7_9BACT
MSFTMKYTAHADRRTCFTKTVEGSGRIHALIPKGSPWCNGFIERSNRTDNEELFSQFRFIDAEDRRYQLRLWEMSYNCRRPHQGLGNQIPLNVYRRDFPIQAVAMGIT